ncbi:HAD family hydrolase [Halomonas sp. PR-M31]|uniref:KdsC family phosphatase n=1 Tax=Halomonas sp. PR-M31 TaxID=1471202 RepID=UPI000650803C|nr:HAD-IIIA family hydrolase [Halomonas sp. PR-M31]
MTLDYPLDDSALIQRAHNIRLLALDVDGVMTDGRLHFQSDDQESKTFNTQDGLGIKLLRQTGIQVAIITGRESSMVTRRAEALGIEHVIQGRDDKFEALQSLLAQLNMELQQVAYCGDDLPDLSAIKHAGLGISVPNAPLYIREHADWVTERPGGHGAVRDICDSLLAWQGHWPAIFDTYLHGKG